MNSKMISLEMMHLRDEESVAIQSSSMRLSPERILTIDQAIVSMAESQVAAKSRAFSSGSVEC